MTEIESYRLDVNTDAGSRDIVHYEISLITEKVLDMKGLKLELANMYLKDLGINIPIDELLKEHYPEVLT